MITKGPEKSLRYRWLARLGVRSDETRFTLYVAAIFAVTQASHGLGANAADALFFVRFGVEELPTMITISGVAVMIVILAHAAGLASRGSRDWLWKVTFAGAVWVVVEWASLSLEVDWVYPIIWVSTQALIMVTFTVMWNAAEAVCTTRQAKRLFSLFAAAGVAGGLAGNLLTGPIASVFGTGNILVVQGLLLLASTLVLKRAGLMFRGEEESTDAADLRIEIVDALATIRSSPLLKLAAAVSLALSTLFFLVVFPFNESVTAAFGSEAEIAAFLGVFSSTATAATFVISLTMVNRLFARLGIVLSLMLVPVVYAGGFATWLLGFGLLSASLVRGMQWVAVNAVGGTAFTALFNTLPGRRRGQVMAFMTAVPTQIGTVLAGLILMNSEPLPQEIGFGIGLGLALLVIGLVVAMRPAYLAGVVVAVKRGLVGVFDVPNTGLINPIDGDAKRMLQEGLRDPRPEARAIAVAALAHLRGESDASGIEGLLSDESRIVRSAAFDTMCMIDPGNVGSHVAKALADDHPHIRLQALHFVGSNPETHDARWALPALDDEDARVRAAAAAVVGGEIGASVAGRLLDGGNVDEIEAVLTEVGRSAAALGLETSPFLTHPSARVRKAAVLATAALSPDEPEMILPGLDDRSIEVRTQSARLLAATERGRDLLIQILETGSVLATDCALQALTPLDRFVPAVTEWAQREAQRAAFLSTLAQAVRSDDPTPAGLLLSTTLGNRAMRLIQWVLLAMTTRETSAIMPVVKRGIASTDAETHAQALEALETVGSRSVSTVLMPLLEPAQASTLSSRTDALRDLVSDFDPWLRALAVRCLAEEQIEALDDLQGAALADESALVRGSWPRFEIVSIDGGETLDTMDRVISLQRVPMFSALDPEDLELLAGATQEVRYEPGQLIYADGAKGDQMLVIIDGDVVVSKQHGPTRDVVKVIGPGEHVGELALLGEETRVADVTAGEQGVLGLAMKEADLMSCLEERPQVALGMLRTLARRLAEST